MVLPTGRAAARFTDPGTRMLLAGEGLTTPVLERMLATRLQVRVLRQDLVPVTDVPGEVTALLGLGSGGEALVRRSCLVDPDLSPVSLNQVIAATAAADGRLYGDVTSLDTPIGHSLIGRRVPQRREILHVGRSTWWHGGVGRPCAVRSYVMLIDDEPWCHIRECFNPRHVPSAVAGTVTSAVAPAPARPQRDHLRDGPVILCGGRGGTASFPAQTGRIAAHQPPSPARAQVAAGVERLHDLPPIVSPDECRALTTELARTVTGDAFVLQLGDRAETSAGCTPGRVRARQALLTVGAALLGVGTGRPVVALATLNHLRAHPHPPGRAIKEIIAAAVAPGAATGLIGEIGHLLTAALDVPPRSRCLHSLVPPIYTSHDALTLPYEEALTRRTTAGEWWDSSAHLLRLGHRTRDLRHAQIAFAARIRNPIAVTLGPSARPEDVAALCSVLNPYKLPGRLTLVARLGAARVGELLPPLVQAAAGVPVTWMCDPTHGDTRTTGEGRKFHLLEDITEEIRAFFRVHRDLGTTAGGVHLEAAAEDVTECDPRLDPAQTLEFLILVMRELRHQAMARKNAGESG
ncbi:3-deoxy-7-phosphoheptulonate synthase [Spirillospora sp. NPDC048911]|uniref:3-deoxy-7-phosphoheptulonate synthase n=1 Tax=Spirillospora sp. NPDC048911 TaxID=3364527 RepID=UPI0037205C7D